MISEVFLLFCPPQRDKFQYNALQYNDATHWSLRKIHNKDMITYANKNWVLKQKDDHTYAGDGVVVEGVEARSWRLFYHLSRFLYGNVELSLPGENADENIVFQNNFASLKRTTEDDVNVILLRDNWDVSTCIAATYWRLCCPSGLL